jgi:CRP-like cAMP-binding protein
MIADCPLGLVSAYCQLGLRPYGGRLINDTGKITVPLAAVIADLENLRRCRSLLYLTIWRLRAAGRLPTRDHSALLVPFAESGIESNAARVREAMERSCARHGAPFLGRLPPRTRARLAEIGQIVDIAPGVSIFDEGYADRDLFVVLEGALELRVGGVAVAAIGAGEVVGEVAFARDSGHRSGAVRSVSQTRLLHLRHGALRRALARHPEDATAFYAALSAVLAERLVDANARARRSSAGDWPAGDAADLRG